MKINNIALVTGGFDPLHEGHIKYFSEAKKDIGYLVVGLNSDTWLKRKRDLTSRAGVKEQKL